MKISRIVDQLLPPIVTRWAKRREREEQEQRKFREFYGQFVDAGNLYFDIGANLGNRVTSFRDPGCRVIAAEPQAKCMAHLRKRFGSDPDVVLVSKAVGRERGQATLRVSDVHVLSTMSSRFMEGTTESGRFAGVKWDGEQVVEVTTLDVLIGEYGLPDFVKIDVEGHEPEVLAGLSVAVPALSIEWTPELYDNTASCIRRLVELGDYEFNLSWGESMKFSRPQWRSAESMLAVLKEFEGESRQFGDVYARLKEV